MAKKRRKMNRAKGFAQSIVDASRLTRNGYDPASATLNDLAGVALNIADNSVSVTVHIPVGQCDGLAEYEESIDLDETDVPQLRDAAAKLVNAALTALKERQYTNRELPCATCTSACCGKELTSIRVTASDVERMIAAGLDIESGVKMYETSTFGGHVGELQLSISDDEETECVFLSPWGCGIYEHRPDICRDFSPWDCELHEPDADKLEGKVKFGEPSDSGDEAEPGE